MKKKILASVVCAAAVLSLAGCGSDTPIAFDTPNSQTSEASSTANSTASTSPESKPGMWDNIPEIPVTADDAFKYEYNSEMGGMVITDYLKESPKVRIPDTLEDEPVVGVDLYDCEKQITELVMPDTVLGWGLSNTIKEHLQYIGLPSGAFDFDVESKVPGFSDHFDSYGNSYGDYYGSSYGGSYGGSYGESAALNAEAEEAFYSYLLDIITAEFEYCGNLLAVGIGEKSPRFVSYDGMMYYKYKGGRIFVFCPRGRTESVNIPNEVTEIGKNAFRNCKKIKSVSVPKSVTEIKDGAFYGCEELTSITIPNSVTEIKNNIFDGCENISVTYKGKTYDRGHIGEFYDLLIYGESMVNGVSVENGVLIAVSPNATAIIIPDNITEVDENLLYNCPKLETIQFKNKTYNWSNRNERDKLLAVFRGEEGLTIENGVLKKVDPDLTEVKIPDRVTSIFRDYEGGAFKGCDKVKKVEFGKGITTLSGDMYEGNVVYGCSNVTEVFISEGVTSIDFLAFEGCKELKKISLPNTLNTIGTNAFVYCTNLTNITIPDSVTSISAPKEHTEGIPLQIVGAFYGCENIKATYKGKTYDYAHIDDLYKAINGDTDGLTISSDGVLTAVSPELTEVVIPDRVTDIAHYPYDTPAFFDCENVKKVTFGKGMSGISGHYFAGGECSVLAGCYNITEIIIPVGVTSIDSGAFNGLSTLETVSLPEGLKVLGDEAFAACTHIREITIPDSVTQITPYVETEPGSGIHFSNIESYGAFYNCENIKATYKGKTYDYAHIDDLYKAVNGN